MAGRLGAVVSLGVEIDPDCRENLAENRDLNGMAPSPFFCIGGIETIRAETGFDVIIMNMIYNESAPLLQQCTGLLKPDGILIWSGILVDDHGQAVTAAESSGLTKITSSVENEWWCGIFASSKT